jgi:O-antigen/teichoic acid export membrane protein
MKGHSATVNAAAGLLARHRKILGEGAWVFAGQALSGAFNLGGTRLITQYIAPELYGIVNLLQNALVLLRTLFCSPLFAAQLRYAPDAERGGYRGALFGRLRRILGWATVAMELVAIAGGTLWAWRAGGNPLVIAALVFYIFVDVFRTLEMTALNAARRQSPAALASAAEALLKPLLVVGVVWLCGPSVTAVLGAIAASIGLTLVGLLAAREHGAAGDSRALPVGFDAELRRYAVPLIPAALLTWITSVSDRYIVQWLTHDPQGVGLYAAGYGLASQPFLILQAVIALTLRPVYYAAVSHGDVARARRTFRVWLAGATATCLAATALIVGWRHQLVSLMLGPKYQGAAVVLPWIAAGYLFCVIEQVIEQPLLAHKRTGAVLVAQAGGAAVSIIATVWLVSVYGMPGAAYACPVYFLIQGLIAGVLVLLPAQPREA